MKDKVEITEEQWERVVKHWNDRPKDDPPSLKELTEICFGRDLDGRSVEGKALRDKLAQANLKPKIAGDYERKGYVEFSEEQKEFIKNNSKNMSPVEIGRVLLKNKRLTNLNQEIRSIAKFIKDEGLVTNAETKNVPEETWRPPRTELQVIEKINRYIHAQIDPKKMNGKQKKDVASLLGYLNTYRFNHVINTYEKQQDRDLFESEFIRCSYDKYDLTEEEVDQYIVYSNEVVVGSSIIKRTEVLNKLLDEIAESDSKDRRISMGLIEAINSARTESHQCITRQNKLLDSLKVKRSEKEGKAKEGAASVLNLVQLWKDEDSRLKMIEYAKKRQEVLKDGIEEISSMDELKAKMIGLTHDEAIYG